MPVLGTAAHRGLTPYDSLQRGLLSPSRRSGDFIPDDTPCDAATEDCTALAVTDAPLGYFQGAAQPLPLEWTLSGPVHSVSVSGSGAILCSGDYGVLTAYDASGAPLASVPLSLIDASDCSPASNPDNVTYGAHGILYTTGIVARVELTPMSPREFPVLGVDGGRASQTYSLRLGRGTAPVLSVACAPAAQVRGQDVACTGTMSDGSDLTPVHLTSVVDGITVNDFDTTAAPAKQIVWAGEAIAATQVTMRVSAGGQTVTGSGTFDVTTRVGVDEAWKAPTIEASAPAIQYVPGAPLADYPGISPAPGGYAIDEAAVGLTVFEYANPKFAVAKRGPDKGIAYMLAPRWAADPRTRAAAKGIYVQKSLESADPFYLLQTGPDGSGIAYCSPADMATLSTAVGTHEALHWTTAYAVARDPQATFHAAMESLHLVHVKSVAELTSAYAAIATPYALAITASVTSTHAANDIQNSAPRCAMRFP